MHRQARRNSAPAETLASSICHTSTPDLSTNFQSTSLHVFESKKLWSEFRGELSKQNVTNAQGVKMLLQQFIQDNESEIKTECESKLKRLSSTCSETEASTTIGSVLSRMAMSIRGDGVRRTGSASSQRSSISKEDSWKKKAPGFVNILTNPIDASMRTVFSDESERSWSYLDESYRNMDEYQNVIRGDTGIFTVHTIATKHGETEKRRTSNAFSFRRKGSHSTLDSSIVSSASIISRLSGNVSFSEVDPYVDDDDDDRSICSTVGDFYNAGEDLYSSQYEADVAASMSDEEEILSDDKEDEDSDRSNNGEFEFPSESRRVFHAKVSAGSLSSKNGSERSAKPMREQAQANENLDEKILQVFGSGESPLMKRSLRRVPPSFYLDQMNEQNECVLPLAPDPEPIALQGRRKSHNAKVSTTHEKSAKNLLSQAGDVKPSPVNDQRREVGEVQFRNPDDKTVVIDWGDSNALLDLLFEKAADDDSDSISSDYSQLQSYTRRSFA